MIKKLVLTALITITLCSCAKSANPQPTPEPDLTAEPTVELSVSTDSDEAYLSSMTSIKEVFEKNWDSAQSAIENGNSDIDEALNAMYECSDLLSNENTIKSVTAAFKNTHENIANAALNIVSTLEECQTILDKQMSGEMSEADSALTINRYKDDLAKLHEKWELNWE